MSPRKKSSRSWASRLVGEFVDGGSFSALAQEHMDQLLAWLAGREGPSSDLITAEVSARSLDKTEAKRLALSALDEYLFGNDLSDPLAVLGLDGASDQETIKNRYRRLMQVYHPDRAVVHGDWLTKRAETINQAYSRLNKIGRGKPREHIVPPAPQMRPSYGAQAGKGVYSAPQDTFHIRKSLGSAQKFQRGVLITLVVLSVLVLGPIYISSREGNILPGGEPTVALASAGKSITGLDDSRQAVTGIPRQNGASSIPADGQSSAAVERPGTAVAKEIGDHAEGSAEEVAAENRDDIQEVDQRSAGADSAAVPKRKEGAAGSVRIVEATRQAKAIDPKKGAMASHEEIAKKTGLVKDRSIASDDVKPAAVHESQKKTASAKTESRTSPPSPQSSRLAGKKKAEPAQTRHGIGKIERKKKIASAPAPARNAPELPRELVVSATRQQSKPEESKRASAKGSGKGRSVSSGVEPRTAQKGPKQTDPGWLTYSRKPPKSQDFKHSGKRKPEPTHTAPRSAGRITKLERKKNIASAPQSARNTPELSTEPVVPDSRRSVPNAPKKSERAAKNSASTATVSRKGDIRPDYPRKPTTRERFVAKKALIRYVDGIVEGDINKLSSAIGQKIIVDGTLKSRGRLVTEYRTLFRNTLKRKYDFLIKSWRYIGNRTIRIRGDADIRYEYHSSSARAYKGKLAYYFVKKGQGVALVRIMKE